jgi:poly(A) polymerase Pap1
MNGLTCSLLELKGGNTKMAVEHRSVEELTAELSAVRSRLAEAKATDAMIEKLEALVAEQAELEQRREGVLQEIQSVVRAVYKQYAGRRAPTNRMAAALKVTPTRVYQIRDEPRH